MGDGGGGDNESNLMEMVLLLIAVMSLGMDEVLAEVMVIKEILVGARKGGRGEGWERKQGEKEIEREIK